MMWSDPEDLETWAVSPRGARWLFGRRVTQEFNEINGLELIAAWLVQEGLKYMFPDKSLVTVWSAPNYCYRCGAVYWRSTIRGGTVKTTGTPENSTMMAPRSRCPLPVSGGGGGGGASRFWDSGSLAAGGGETRVGTDWRE